MVASKMKPYYWMVHYTRQSQWIDGWGVWLWLAFVVGGLGCGLYLVSLHNNYLEGMIIGWVIGAVLKGLTHLVYLGKPWRAWRAFLRPQTSWISRGIIFVLGYAVLGFAQWAPTVLTWLPWSSEGLVLRGVAALFAFLVMMYPGFTMGFVRGIPFWNNGILPVVFITYGLLGGFGLSIPLALARGDHHTLVFLESGVRVLLVVAAVLLAFYLATARYGRGAGRKSVEDLLSGQASAVFYLGVVILGIVVPLCVSLLAGAAGPASSWLLGIGVASELVGSFSLRYCLLKSGFYAPLVPSNYVSGD